MENTKLFLQNLLQQTTSKDSAFKRNLAKQYFQILILDYMYSNKEYNQLFFYGGTCLAHCFGLPRLSEDLDFVDVEGNVDRKQLAADLKTFLTSQLDVNVATRLQKFRTHFKFPILWDIGLAQKSESNILMVKLEIFPDFNFCKKYTPQFVPLFKFNRSIVVKTFDLPTLMATKIRAILYRKWEKTDKKGKISITVKGRDYFDLFWYLQKNVQPNLACIEKGITKEQLQSRLIALVQKADTRSIRLDLESFLEKKEFAQNIGKNIKNILLNEIERKL